MCPLIGCTPPLVPSSVNSMYFFFFTCHFSPLKFICWLVLSAQLMLLHSFQGIYYSSPIVLCSCQLIFGSMCPLWLFYPEGTTTAWRPSATMTCWIPPTDAKWPRATRPVSVWRTRHVTAVYGDASPVLLTHRSAHRGI